MAGMPPVQADAAAFSRVSVHDPSVVKLEDGSYYIIGSHLGAARSEDLMNWQNAANSDQGSTRTTFFGNIYTDLAKPAAWSSTSSDYDLSGNLWAPDIIWNPQMNKYCMYLSVNGVDWHSSIVLCTADNIDGPYTYVDTIVYSGFETNPADAANSYKNTDVERVLGSDPDLSRYLTSAGRWNAEYGTNAIDPCVFYDEGGNLWMVYGSWFGGIFMLELDETTGLRDYNVTYPYTANYSDPYLGTHVAGGHWASGEGPYIEYMTPPGSNKGYYYLFLSYGYFHPNGGYNMRVFRSENPAGPYVDQNGNSPICLKGTDNIGGTVGERLMSNYKWSCNGYSFKAQGHNSALMDDDGKLFVIYHTKFGGLGLFHEVRVHQMIMNEDGWITASAYEYNGESLSADGHTMEAMAGDYEFLVNTLDQGYKTDWSDAENNDTTVGLATPVSVSLNKDGSVTGDITGKWSVTSGTPYMSITYGGTTYKGAFLVQQDESDAMVTRMTFTATGNNICVWGSKKTAYDITEDLVDRTASGSRLVYAADADAQPTQSIRLGDTDLLDGVSYTITNRFSGKALDVPGGQAVEGTAMQQWNLTGGSHQEWRISEVSDGWCRISSMKDETMCLGVQGGSAENAAVIEIERYTGADSQLWKFVQQKGCYGIVSKSSGGASGIDVYGWSEDNGGEIRQWEFWGGDCQLWTLTPVHPAVNAHSYAVRSVLSGLFLSSAGTGLSQLGEPQGWTITPETDTACSVRTADGLALTIADGADGTDLTLEAYTGDASQQFRFYPNADGSYTILTEASGEKSAFDVYGISRESGAKICQWSYWGGEGQHWVLVPYTEEVPEDPTEEPTEAPTDAPTDAPTEEPTDAPTDAPTQALTVTLWGDADVDGDCDIIDVICVNKDQLGSYQLDAQGMLNADVDRSGTMNFTDAVNIMKALVDLATLPVA